MAFGNYNQYGNSYTPYYQSGPQQPPQQQNGSYSLMPSQQNRYDSQQSFSPVPQITLARNQDGSPIWVTGISGARSYNLNRGESAMFMDSDDSYFYVKSTDANTGRPTIRVYAYYEVDPLSLQNGASQAPQGDYVSKSDFDALKQELARLTQAFNAQNQNGGMNNA